MLRELFKVDIQFNRDKRESGMGKYKNVYSIPEGRYKWLGLIADKGRFSVTKMVRDIVGAANSLYSLAITNMGLDKKKRVIEAVLLGVMNFRAPWIIMQAGSKWMLRFFRMIVVRMHKRLLDLGSSPLYSEAKRQLGAGKYLESLKGIMEKFYGGVWDYEGYREEWGEETKNRERYFWAMAYTSKYAVEVAKTALVVRRRGVYKQYECKCGKKHDKVGDCEVVVGEWEGQVQDVFGMIKWEEWKEWKDKREDMSFKEVKADRTFNEKWEEIRRVLKLEDLDEAGFGAFTYRKRRARYKETTRTRKERRVQGRDCARPFFLSLRQVNKYKEMMSRSLAFDTRLLFPHPTE